MRFLATIVSAALLTACATIAGAPPARLAADPFYRKHVDAAGIPILSSARVPDAALFAARALLTKDSLHLEVRTDSMGGPIIPRS